MAERTGVGRYKGGNGTPTWGLVPEAQFAQ